MPLPAVHGGQIMKKVRPNKQYRRVSRLPVETRNGRRLGNVWGFLFLFWAEHEPQKELISSS